MLVFFNSSPSDPNEQSELGTTALDGWLILHNLSTEVSVASGAGCTSTLLPLCALEKDVPVPVRIRKMCYLFWVDTVPRPCGLVSRALSPGLGKSVLVASNLSSLFGFPGSVEFLLECLLARGKSLCLKKDRRNTAKMANWGPALISAPQL